MEQFEQNQEYNLSDLPESDMTPSGNLEALGEGMFAARYGDVYVTFEFSKVRCVNVQDVEDVLNRDQ